MTDAGRRGIRIAIVGAGPGGLCMGIQLRKAGFEEFAILEKSTGVGGTVSAIASGESPAVPSAIMKYHCTE